jgi:hypothetical protein
MQQSGPSPLVLAHVVAILAVLAAPLPGFVMSQHVFYSACFENCSTPDFYFAQLAPLEALFMFPCVALTAFAVAVFVPYCQATQQTGRALCVFLFFLLGGLLGAAALYGLAQLALADPASKESVAVNQQATDWIERWTNALVFVAVVWSGSLAFLQWPAEWSPESEQLWRRVGQRWRHLSRRAAP